MKWIEENKAYIIAIAVLIAAIAEIVYINFRFNYL